MGSLSPNVDINKSAYVKPKMDTISIDNKDIICESCHGQHKGCPSGYEDDYNLVL